MTRVLAVCGSRREGSYTRSALWYALDAAAEAGAEVDYLDLGAVDLPLYHPDVDEQGESADLMERTRAADGILLGTPVYHGSYSSTFRNYHDYCSFDEYEDTVVGLLATAGGGSYGSTLEHMRSTVRGVHGWVVPHQVGIRKAYDRFEARGPATPDASDRGGVVPDHEFVDDSLRERTEKLGRVVARHATAMAETGSPVRADD
ncbi:NADPH-dependent FMN reductase [Halobium salinum]|uniref:NADPH-dependent FMN reductase n=1 Tax=Halobium salinum TaxID=1364940 RepID=A0ABD5PFH7_9EURY|nr:NADPH-dependent FMN reductase [Halobium salinum]